MPNRFKGMLIASMLLAAAVCSFCQEAEKKDGEKKKNTSIRFHSGVILAAELLPEGFFNPVIMNLSKFEPPSRITSDVAYATVTVRLDTGRSLSTYDYTLLNRRKDEYKCIGISEGDGKYDADKWELSNAKATKLYTMLFKVQLPTGIDKDEYFLKYSLNKKRNEEVAVPFVRISRPFTATAKIPAEGIVGIDPEPPPPPKPVEEVKAEPPKDEPKKEEKKEEVKKEEAPAESSTAADSMLKFVPDAKGNQVIYELDLAKTNGAVKYGVDNRKSFKKKFDRIAYYMELKTDSSELQYVYVSMEAFTDSLDKIGVPTFSSKAKFQETVSNMNVYSNVKGVVTGKGLKGNIEFWPGNYKEKNANSVPNASDTIFDFGDEISGTDEGYGSMQIHNYEAKQTIFAFNNWREGNNADMGIGNSTGKTKDWTFTRNAGTYKIRFIRVLVSPK